MSDCTARVGRRTNRETYLIMSFGSNLEAGRVYGVLHDVAAMGGLDSKSYVVVCMCPRHGIEILLVLAIGTDHDAQIAAVVEACRQRLSLNIRCRDMKVEDYEPHAMLARMARSQGN